MKKIAVHLLSVLILLGIVAGIGTNSAFAAQPEGTPSAAFAVDGSVLFEKDGVRVTTAGLDTDPTSGDIRPIIWVDIENGSGEDTCLGLSNGSVNGFMCDVLFMDFYIEDGEYYGSSDSFSLALPAEGNGRYALSYYKQNIPGVDMDTLGELAFYFTLAEDEYSWPSYTSEPVVIKTGEDAEAVDLAALGTVVIDNDELRLVIGEQDYDDWFGPTVYVYAENKTESVIGIAADTAEADGAYCDYLYYYTEIAPGRQSAGQLSFDGDIREMKGFEELTVAFKLFEAQESDAFGLQDGVLLDPVTVQYPPQIWGEYENGGLCLDIQPKYNDLITVETPADDESGVLFSVAETASLEAGGYEGAGWLFAIGTVSEDKLHEMLCNDMSGASVFARDENGSYYLYYHPTDVRYERAAVEELQRDQAQWTMLCEWAETVPEQIIEKNGLENASYSNTPVDMYLARAAWMADANATLSTTEYGPAEIAGVDGAPYAEFVLRGWFWEANPEETPDGEYVVLSFPEEDVRLDFFFAPGAYVRVVAGDEASLYQAVLYDDDAMPAEVMKGWYYAAAEHAGIKPLDTGLEHYSGLWYEKLAGRGEIEISQCLAPGKANIAVRWPNSAMETVAWTMAARLEGNRLAYEDGEREVLESDEDGNGWTTDWSGEESGYFYRNGSGELVWHNDASEGGEDSVFIR